MAVYRGRTFLLVVVVAVLCGQRASAQLTVKQTAPIDAEALLQTVRTLTSPEFEGRRTGTPGNAKARAWIVERFREIGLVPPGDTFQMPFTFTRPSPASGQSATKGSGEGNSTPVEGVNIVGTCRGSGANAQGSGASVMAITAHYDHLGVRDGAMYPGADDNASGIAVILELARRCVASPWTHGAMFIAFDAEEQGLQGARAFVAAPPIPKERIALNVNLDMVSRNAKRELYVAGTYHRPALKPVLEPIAARAPFTVLFGHDRPKERAGGADDWTTQSDHGAFHAAGIPFVYFGVEDHPDYHKPTDTADKIDKTFFAQVAATIFDAVTVLDRALPLR